MKNKHMKKWMLILAIALCLNAVAFAEGDEPAAPAQVEQVKEEKKAETPKHAEEEKKAEPEAKAEPEKPAAPEAKPEAEKPAEPEVKPETEKPAEPAPEAQVEAAAPAEEVTVPVEAPSEPAAPAEDEAPAEPEVEIPATDEEQTETFTEETEVGSEETAGETAQAPADGGEVEIDEYDTPLGVTTDAEPTPFNANVQLQMRNQGEIFYGDTVTLEADITGATGAYDIRWEVDCHDDKGWTAIAGQNGSSYNFVITENNASYDYRVVLTGQA